MDSIEYEIETEYEIFYTIEPGQSAVVDFAGMLISPAIEDLIDIVDVKLYGESLSASQQAAFLDGNSEEVEDKITGVELVRDEDAEIEREVWKFLRLNLKK